MSKTFNEIMKGKGLLDRNNLKAAKKSFKKGISLSQKLL